MTKTEPMDWWVTDLSDLRFGYRAFGPMTRTDAEGFVAEASQLRQGNLWAHDSTVRRSI